MTYHEQIAKARSVFLGVEDHGILTATIDFDYGGSGQGIAGRGFDSDIEYTIFKGKYSDGTKYPRVGLSFGMEWIRRLLMAFGVHEWKDIAGRTVYTLREDDGWNAPIMGIRPLPTEGGQEFIFNDLKVLIDESKDLIKEKE